MILKALYDLAVREDLVPDPDFEIKPVSWTIRVGDGGKFLGIISNKQPEQLPPESKKKPKMFGVPKFVPYQGGRTGNDKAYFLVDKSEYVLGLDPSGEREPEKLKKRLKLFLDEVEQCWKSTNLPQLQAVVLFIQSVLDGDVVISLPEGCLSNDLFAYSYSVDECLIHEDESVKAYWKQRRSKDSSEEEDETYCSITGFLSTTAIKLPQIKKVPGGSTSGVALVSYNSSAFESYGWAEKPGKPVANASISEAGALAAMTALNRLVDPSPPDPKDPNQTLPRQNVKLSSDTVVCYWTKNGGGLSDILGLAIEIDPEKVGAKPEQIQTMYKSLWKGVPYKLNKPDRFYSLVLSGGQGRATVRDWIESNAQYVSDSLAQYFADLRIARCCPPAKGKIQPEGFPLSDLLESLADPKETRKDGIPSAIGAQFYRASIDQKLLFPQTAFHRAILRYRAELGKESYKWIIKHWNDARAAIIKAYLIRKLRKESKQTEVKEEMNPYCKEQGYLLGQLMAVLEKLQQEALDGVNATIVDRYFSGASTSPKSVFGNLLRNARHHVSKIKDNPEKRGAVRSYENLIDQLCSQFEISVQGTSDPQALSKNGFPSTLTQDEQGMFVLGYHQMRKWLWMNRKTRDEWNAAHADAPKAYLWKKKETVDVDYTTDSKGEN